MHPMVYLMLLAGPCLAHYRFEPRNLVERDEQQEKGRGEWVDCPVCGTPRYSSLSNSEECAVHEGRSAKLCLYGTYINRVCGSRLDCYRGPGEPCTEKLEEDVYGQECAPGWVCNRYTGKCAGLGNPYKTGELAKIINDRYALGARRDI